MRDQDHLVPPQMIEQVSDIVCHGGHRVIARWAVRRVPETTHVHGAAQAVGAQSRTEVNPVVRKIRQTVNEQHRGPSRQGVGVSPTEKAISQGDVAGGTCVNGVGLNHVTFISCCRGLMHSVHENREMLLLSMLFD